MIMLSVAAGYAEAHEIPEVFYAAHKNDSTIYPDCRPEFVQALRPAIRLATAWHPVELQAPFVNMSKAEIVRMGLALKVPYELTWSCYRGEEKPCRTCPTCIEREEAFALNGCRDPLVEDGN
jgi:7-cyano-7-deazaguanine synthase